MKKAISLISFVASNQLHKRRICLVTIKKSGNYMTIVLSDMHVLLSAAKNSTA